MSTEEFGESLKSIAQRLSRVLTGEKRRSEFYGHIDGQMTTICQGTFPNDQLLAIFRKAVPFAVQGGAFDEDQPSSGRMPIGIDYLVNTREANVAFVDLTAINLVTFTPCDQSGQAVPDDNPEFFMSTWHAAGNSLKYHLRSRDAEQISKKVLVAADKAKFVYKKINHELTLLNPMKVLSVRVGDRIVGVKNAEGDEGIEVSFIDGMIKFVVMPEDDARFFFEEVFNRQRGF